jgi:hypothetical protein
LGEIKVPWLFPQNSLFFDLVSAGTGFCCEIDESCGKIAKFIDSMENCLTFSHEYLGLEVGEEYWTHGSMARRAYYHMAKKMHLQNSADIDPK